MANDIFNVEPPSWLQRSVSGQPQSLNKLAGMAGNYIGAGATTLTGSGDTEIESRPGYQRFRTNLANNYKQEQDPMWRLKEIGLRTRLAQLKLQADNYGFTNKLRQQTLIQQASAMQELDALKQEALSKDGNPLDVPYLGSNPFTQKQWGNVQLQYSRGLVSKRLDSDRVRINKLVDDLDMEDRSTFLQIPRGDDGMPTTEGWAFLKSAGVKAQARIESEKKAKADLAERRVETSEFNSGLAERRVEASENRPLSSIGKLVSDFDKRVAEGKDVTAFESEFEKHNKNSEVEFKETEIGGKPATVISKPGSNAWRVIVHSENNKGDIVKLQSAYRAKDSAQKALLNSRTLRNPEARANAEKYILEADKQIEELSSSLDTPGSVSAPSPETSSSANTNEVTRFTESGRPAIFDAKTKKFLRYAN